MHIPNQSESYWKDHEAPRSFAPLNMNLTVDVTVVGGGITGILTAWKLSKEGKKVALIEAGNLTDGTTGFTTAKVSSQHGPIYHHLIQTVGEEKARLYYKANEEAIAFLRKTVQEMAIDCDWSDQDAYIYIQSDKMKKVLEKERDAYAMLGINGGYAATRASENLPYGVEEALVIRNQAQFHPVSFLEALVEDMAERVHIFENTRAESIDSQTVKTTTGYSIMSEDIVVATHFPFNDFNGAYFAKLHPERSYIVAVKGGRRLEEGMYISEDMPSRSVRYATLENGEQLLLIGGESHQTGRSKVETIQHYEELAAFAEQHFGATEVLYRWSAQDLITLDKIPYIGRQSDHIYMATGYAKWGMSSGTAAASLLTELIMGRESDYEELYDPKRSKAKAADAKTFIAQNAIVAKELVSGKLKSTVKTIDDLEPDEGGIVMMDGLRTGAYKDETGQCFAVDTTCTHMGCETVWNGAERSWDCPCHGSRFSFTGKVLEGPAVKPLNRK